MPGDDASTAEAAPGRVERDEKGEARRANTTPKGGPHLELRVGRLRLETWSKSDLSIAETTWPTYLVYTYQGTWYLLIAGIVAWRSIITAVVRILGANIECLRMYVLRNLLIQKLSRR